MKYQLTRIEHDVNTYTISIPKKTFKVNDENTKIYRDAVDKSYVIMRGNGYGPLEQKKVDMIFPFISFKVIPKVEVHVTEELLPLVKVEQKQQETEKPQENNNISTLDVALISWQRESCV